MKYLVVQAFRTFDQNSGEFSYRVKHPGSSLKTHPSFEVIDLHLFHPLFPQLATTADVLILHMLPDEELFRVIYNRRRMGKPTIFEISQDFTHADCRLPENCHLSAPEVRQNLMYFASICDGLWFANQALAEKYVALNENRVVLEDQANHFSDKRPPRRPFNIGWLGAADQEDDLAAIAPVVIDFCRRHKDAVFHFMGYPPIFHRHFGKLSEKQKVLVEAAPTEDMSAFLAGIHVGLAPLAGIDANACCSDVRFVEYAAHGVVPVLADVAPYRVHARHGENALLFKDPDELGPILGELYQDDDLLNQLSSRALRYARVKRNQSHHLGRRVIFLEKVLKHEPFVQKVPPLPDCAGLITYLRRATKEFALGQYQEALDILEKVLQLHPGFQLAHVWKARTMLELGHNQEVLQAYSAFKIDQVYFDLFLEILTIAAQRLQNPLWMEFHKLLVNPVVKAGLDPELSTRREERFQTILSNNPYHYTSLVNLAKIMINRKDPDCMPLFDMALNLAPEARELALLRQHAMEMFDPA